MLVGDPIPTLKSGTDGHHFVIYGDSCSGIAGALHEGTFRQVNETIRALETPPQFICFLGDEIMGLTVDRDELDRKWQYYFQREMLGSSAMPSRSITPPAITQFTTIRAKMSSAR